MSPIYSYVCKHDGTEAEVRRPMHESLQPWRCPTCNRVMQRVFSPPVLARDGKYSYRADEKGAA